MASIFSKKSVYAQNLILELDPLAERLGNSGRKVVKLNRGDPPRFFPTPKYIIDAYVKALREGATYYSRSQGLVELVEAVIGRYKRMYRMKLQEDDVITTAGVSEALLFINNAIMNRGERAVLFAPYYPQYIPRLMIEGGVPLIGNMIMDKNWDVDLDGLSRKLKKMKRSGKNIKYMMVTNPHNPTGKVFERKDLKELVQVANDYGVLLISDEIYDEIVYNGKKFTSIGEVAKGVPHMILNGSSKNFDSTGFRIGFMIIPGKDRVSESLKRKFSQYALVRLSLNTPSEYAVAEAMNNRKEHEKAIRSMTGAIEKRVNFAVDLLRENPYVTVTRPSGAFYILPKLDMKDLNFKSSRDFVVSALMETGVQMTGGYSFGAPSNFRIAALPPEETLEYAINRINGFCLKHAKK
jgi:alanine-synthesizing transaminase